MAALLLACIFREIDPWYSQDIIKWADMDAELWADLI